MAWTCVGEPTIIDPLVWDLYCNGYSEQEAARQLMSYPAFVGEGTEANDPITFHLVVRDVTDQYRAVSYLETGMADPHDLMEGAFPLVTLPDEQIRGLIQQFYAFDGHVMRALLGKQLTGKVRKDLDDISEDAGVRTRVCWRNFDNLRRIFHYMDDLDFSVPLCSAIQQKFCLVPELAWKYACLLFLLKNKFNLTDSKKRLAHVPCEVFISVASAMLCCWCDNAGEAPYEAPWKGLSIMLSSAAIHSPDVVVGLPVIAEHSEPSEVGGVSRAPSDENDTVNSHSAPDLHLSNMSLGRIIPHHLLVGRAQSMPEDVGKRPALPTSFVEPRHAVTSTTLPPSVGPTLSTALSSSSIGSVGRQVSSTTSWTPTDATSVGGNIDNAFMIQIRDLANKLMRSKLERNELAAAVLTLFGGNLRRNQDSLTVTCVKLGTEQQAPQDAIPVAEALRAEGDIIRRVEPKISSVLKHIRDIAAGVISVRSLSAFMLMRCCHSVCHLAARRVSRYI
jgi:hypothetical protein